MVTRLEYNEQVVQAAHAVLLELVHVLGEYREGIALVGGWVPGLLLPEDANEHVGSMDVDIALDHKLLEEAGYETICEKLETRGYRRHEEQPFIFFRDIPAGDDTITVEVDLLAGEYEGAGRRHRTQRVQDAKARKARGCDLVFPMAEKFESPNHIGPNFVADFEETEDGEDREMLKRDVFERVDYLLRGLGIR